jgi:Icc-related predicted phosphoesterase
MLTVSDLHYRLPSYDWLCAVGAEYDAVVLAGDLISIASPVPLEAQIVVVNSYLERLAAITELFVVSGNHDLDGPGEHGEQISSWLQRRQTASVHTDGESVDIGDFRVTLCPWWDGPITRTLLDDQLAVAAQDRLRRWLWVYHAPPAGTPLCSDGRRSFPDEDLAVWIAQHRPDVVICGHIHQAPWVDGGSCFGRLGTTWVFNAGHLPVRVPAHVVIDTAADTAVWYDAGSGVAVHLDMRSGRLEPVD